MNLRCLLLIFNSYGVCHKEGYLPVESNDTVERTLVASTLDGRLIAISSKTGDVKWSLTETPLLKAPLVAQKGRTLLPNPSDGALYMLSEGGRQMKKLPLTIPQLVQVSPCRSSDGVMYAGRKHDVWFAIDRRTGNKLHTLSGDTSATGENVCPADADERSAVVYLSRTEYVLTMFDEKSSAKKWNVTYVDYSSILLPLDFNYKFQHYSSSFGGHLVTVDSTSGKVLWEKNLDSTVVALYLLDDNGFNRLPLTILGQKTLQDLLLPNADKNRLSDECVQMTEEPFADQFTKRRQQTNLYPALYVGESKDGLYAVNSLVDDATQTFVAKSRDLPLIAAAGSAEHVETVQSGQKFVAIDYDLANLYNNEPNNGILLLGYHKVPETVEMLDLYYVSNLPARITLPLLTYPAMGNIMVTPVGNQNHANDFNAYHPTTPASFYENLIRSDFLKILITSIVTGSFIILITVVVLRNIIIKMIVMHSHSMQVSNISDQSLESTKNNVVPHQLTKKAPNDLSVFVVGKISFNPQHILGRGCEGTVVYKGFFDGRDVAVKRVVSDCFNLADREVDLLRSSDFHPNVIRYFSMESDSQFRYIALELCWATLNDYVEKQAVRDECQMSVILMLEQATVGLVHLHSLKIVHRDVKPQNILLTKSGHNGKVKVLISDFGLCKKLAVGRNSFSKRSGFAGTDGWIAPEILCSKTATCSVDIFSLGCVFYFVLSNGKHPFGDSFRRQANILVEDYAIAEMSGPECETWRNLIESMLNTDHLKRPSAAAVLKHPMFWTKSKVLAFFQDVSDRVDKEDPQSPLVQRLEKGGGYVVKKDWRQHICDGLLTDLKSRRTYRGNSVRDLLRAMRNKKNHFRELSDDVKSAVGSVPEELVAYFTCKFPPLLVHVYDSMKISAEEPLFLPYYATD